METQTEPLWSRSAYGFRRYQSARVHTATREDAVLALHDAALASLTRAELLPARDEALIRTHALLSELRLGLFCGQDGEDGEVGSELGAQYDLLLHRITEAFVQQDAAALPSVRSSLRALREVWAAPAA